MQLGIDALDVLQRDRLVQQLLVEGHREAPLQLVVVEHGYAQHPADEVEVGEVFRVDRGVRVDLQGIVIVPAVLEQAVLGVEHLAGQQVEPLARHPSVVEALLTTELHHQAFAHVFWSHFHYKSAFLGMRNVK